MRKWVFTRLKGSWKITYINKHLAGERLLKGTPKDFKMVPCRHHSDYIKRILVANDKIMSLGNNGQVVLWTGSEYNPNDFNQFIVKKIMKINEKIFIIGQNGELQILKFETMELLYNKNIGLDNLRICSKENWIHCIGTRNNEIIGLSWNLTSDATKEINYTLNSFPESIVSNNICIQGHKIYCGFINSIIIWNQNSIRLGNIYKESESCISNTFCEFYSVNNSVFCFRYQTLVVWNNKGEKVNTFETVYNTQNSGVYEYRDKKIGYCNNSNHIYFFDLINLKELNKVSINDTIITSVCFNAYIVAVGTNNSSVRVYDWKFGHQKYVLLLGSMNPKTLPKSFVPNNEKPGCSEVLIDNDRIVVAIGNLIRVYHFDLDG